MGSGGTLSPALRTKKSLLHVSSVVVAVTPGKARTRFREAVGVYRVLHTLLAPQCALYDGVAVGEGRLGAFLVIGGDGRSGVVFPALDDVESPDVKAGVRD